MTTNRQFLYRLITKDGHKSKLHETDEPRDWIYTPIHPSIAAYSAVEFSMASFSDSPIEKRCYRMMRMIPATIIEYEEE